MPGRPLRLPLASIFLVALAACGWLGCGSNEGDGPGAAPPTPTSIPMGAPAAEGARFDPTTPPPPQRPTGIQQKIYPPPTGPGPFGTPPPPIDDEGEGEGEGEVEGPVTPPPPSKVKGGTHL